MMTPEESKQAMKAAIKEWLDDKFKEFGKWTFKTIAFMSLAAWIYFVLRQNGWKLEQH